MSGHPSRSLSPHPSPKSNQTTDNLRKHTRKSKPSNTPQSQQDIVFEYYSHSKIDSLRESRLGSPPHNYNSFTSDLEALSRIRRIVFDLRQELTELTGRLSLEGERHFSYHQKLLLLENQLDKLFRQKENNNQSLPVVLLDDDADLMRKNHEIGELGRRINQLEQLILDSQFETGMQLASLVDEVKRKDRTIGTLNQQLLTEVSSSKVLYESIARVQDNVSRYRHQLGGIERLVLEGVEFQHNANFGNHVTAYPPSNDNRLNETNKLRNTAFHLRVLIKALLEELEKLRRRTGISLEIDERIIQMINQQAGGIIDIEDILQTFQVQHSQPIIMQSHPQRIIEVPEVVIVDKVVEKIVEIQKIREVEKIVNIPIEVPRIIENIVEKIVPVERIVERIVEVPVQRERLVEVVLEIPKVIEVERVVEHFVEVQKVVEVERQINHFVPQIQQIEVFIEKIIPIETIVEKIVQVPVVVEKIVERIVKVPEIIEIEVIVERIVKQVQYVIEKEAIPYIQVQHRIVERIVQKVVPLLQIQQRIVQVPQIVEKIVQIRTIQESLVEVQVIRQKIVIQDRIVEVERIVQQIVPLMKQVQKIVECRVEIPIVVQKLVVVTEYIKQPVIERVTQTVIQQVSTSYPVLIPQIQILEVQKLINHYIQVPDIVKVYEDRIVEVPVYIDRIKEVRVVVEKIVEKMVEVPKVVEIERIVEKVVVVPRVVERIVEVPQVTEVVVDRVITNEVIKEVERIIQVPMIEKEIMEVEVVNNVYIPQERVVEVIVEKLVEVPTYQQKVITSEVIKQKVVTIIQEVPKEIFVQQLVSQILQRPRIIQIQKTILIPVELPVPTELIVQKLIPVYEVKEQLVQIPQIVQKIIEVKVQQIQLHQIHETTRDVYIDTRIVPVPEQHILIEKEFVELPTMIQKIVPVQSVVERIVEVERIMEKMVQCHTEVPRVYEVERVVERMVPQVQVMEIEVPVTQIVRVNQIVTQQTQRIIQVPLIVQTLKEVILDREKIVAVNTTTQQILEVETMVEKPVFIEKIHEVVRNINHVQEKLLVVERLESVLVPVYSRHEIVLEVEKIVEKVVERVVVMPQVREVVRYVHEVTEKENLGMALNQDVGLQQQQYLLLVSNVKESTSVVITELNRMAMQAPHLRGHIEMLSTFLGQLDRLNGFSRVVQVPVEKVVEKLVEVEKIVRVPMQNENSVRTQLSLALLVEKLLMELKRLKEENPDMEYQLEDDIKLIFLADLTTPQGFGEDFHVKLAQFEQVVSQKFQSLGTWTHDHQLMLNSFLQERFVMANILKNTNVEMQKTKMISQKRLEGLKRYKMSKNNYQVAIDQITQIHRNCEAETQGYAEMSGWAGRIKEVIDQLLELEGSGGFVQAEPMKVLEDLKVTDDRILSLLREKQYQILSLRQKISSLEKLRVSSLHDPNIQTIHHLTSQIETLRAEANNFRTQLDTLHLHNSHIQFQSLNQQILHLQQDNTDLRNEVFNLRNELETQMHFSQVEIEQYKIRLENSVATTIPASSPRNFQYAARQHPSNFTHNLYNTAYSSEFPSNPPLSHTLPPFNPPTMSTERLRQQTANSSVAPFYSARESHENDQDDTFRGTSKFQGVPNASQEPSLIVPGVDYDLSLHQFETEGKKYPMKIPPFLPVIQQPHGSMKESDQGPAPNRERLLEEPDYNPQPNIHVTTVSNSQLPADNPRGDIHALQPLTRSINFYGSNFPSIRQVSQSSPTPSNHQGSDINDLSQHHFPVTYSETLLPSNAIMASHSTIISPSYSNQHAHLLAPQTITQIILGESSEIHANSNDHSQFSNDHINHTEYYNQEGSTEQPNHHRREEGNISRSKQDQSLESLPIGDGTVTQLSHQGLTIQQTSGLSSRSSGSEGESQLQMEMQIQSQRHRMSQSQQHSQQLNENPFSQDMRWAEYTPQSNSSNMDVLSHNQNSDMSGHLVYSGHSNQSGQLSQSGQSSHLHK